METGEEMITIDNVVSINKKQRITTRPYLRPAGRCKMCHMDRCHSCDCSCHTATKEVVGIYKGTELLDWVNYPHQTDDKIQELIKAGEKK